MRNNILLFIQNVEKFEQDFIATGSLLEGPEIDKWEQRWFVYLPNQPSRPISIERYFIDWVGSGTNAEGHHATFFDGKEFVADVTKELRDAAQNIITVVTQQEMPIENQPFFLSTDNQSIYSGYDAFVDLSVNCFADLPDVEAYIDVCKEAESIPAHTYTRPIVSSRSARLRSAALNMPLGENMFLPLSGIIEEQSIYGVVNLQQKMSENRFHCKIYVSGRIVLQPGMNLTRDIRWRILDHLKSRSVVIGTIKSCALLQA